MGFYIINSNTFANPASHHDGVLIFYFYFFIESEADVLIFREAHFSKRFTHGGNIWLSNCAQWNPRVTKPLLDPHEHEAEAGGTAERGPLSNPHPLAGAALLSSVIPTTVQAIVCSENGFCSLKKKKKRFENCPHCSKF